MRKTPRSAVIVPVIVTIEMLKDWDRQNDENVDERLQVPAGCNLTLNMNGHMYNRRLT